MRFQRPNQSDRHRSLRGVSFTHSRGALGAHSHSFRPLPHPQCVCPLLQIIRNSVLVLVCTRQYIRTHTAAQKCHSCRMSYDVSYRVSSRSIGDSARAPASPFAFRYEARRDPLPPFVQLISAYAGIDSTRFDSAIDHSPLCIGSTRCRRTPRRQTSPNAIRAADSVSVPLRINASGVFTLQR